MCEDNGDARAGVNLGSVPPLNDELSDRSQIVEVLYRQQGLHQLGKLHTGVINRKEPHPREHLG